MKYSQEFVWNAVFEICPHFKVMKENNLNPNLPSALKDAAVQCFLLKETNEFKLKWEKVIAQHIVFIAFTELTEHGYMTFGTTDTF